MKQTKDLKELEGKIGYTFKDKTLFKQALTHSSYANEHRHEGLKDNERLEFLGDAVLEIISSEYLFYNYPDMAEGEMTTDAGTVYARDQPRKLSFPWQGRRTDRRKKPGFYRI